MKHTPSWTAVILLCLLLVAGAAVLVLTPRTVPFDECSPLYRQYAGHEDIEATFVKDYPVDDTTLVDVTLLHATTDSAWEKLCIAFTPYEFSDSIDYIKKHVLDTSSTTFRTVSKDDPQEKYIPNDTFDFNFVALTAKVKAISVFHINNKSQFKVTFRKIADNALHTNNNTLIQ